MIELQDRKLWRRYKAGYEVWIETSKVQFDAEVLHDPNPEDGIAQAAANEFTMDQPELVTRKAAYTPDGKYIGDPGTAYLLCKKKGIKPETLPGHNVCSIGYNEAERKWYGWSHRAIFGFGVGAVAKEGDCVCSSGWTDEYIAEHPEDDLSLPVGFEAKTLADAKHMAIAFAESVG